ncbi:MAG: DMT family transporter [Pleomorphochaeta sp.]
MKNTNELKGILLAILSATIFGTHPTLVYFLRSGGMNILPTIFVGCIICLAIYFSVLLFTNNLKNIKVSKKQLQKLIISSILFYSTIGVLFYSFTLIPSGLASVIHFAYPALVTIISVLTKRDKLTKALLIALVSTFVGVLLVSNPSNTNINPIGIILAIISAFLYAGYIFMINDECFTDLNNTIFVFYIALIGAILLLITITFESIFILNINELVGSYSNLVLIGGLALGITQGVGVFSFAKAIKYIGGPMGGALAAFEPLTAVIIGVIFFKEPMPIYCVIGCLLILISTIYLSFSKINE